MPNIKFAYPFSKLLDCKGNLIELCQLIQAIKVEASELTQEFRDYDTNGAFTIPATGPVILLILLKQNSVDCFTTIRKYTDERLVYYRDLQGQTFDVVFTEVLMETAG